MRARGKSYRKIAFTEWEVCAALDGGIVQKRVPILLWRVHPKPGDLIWVAEPFHHLLGERQDKYWETIVYRADAGPAGGFPPCEEAKHRRFKTIVSDPCAMYRGHSRLTLEVTRVVTRETSYWEVGERAKEGLPWLAKAKGVTAWTAATAAFNDEFYRSFARPIDAGALLILQFRVHKQNIAAVVAQLEAA